MSNCSQLIICTNATRLPRQEIDLNNWLNRLGTKFTLKISINHHLLEKDQGLFDLAQLLSEQLPLGDLDRQLVLNVRLKKNNKYDQRVIENGIKQRGLSAWANVFYLQKYGLASNQSDWSEPFVVGNNFSLFNPDGTNYKIDLVNRAEAMRRLT
jgi:hypothetical protein